MKEKINQFCACVSAFENFFQMRVIIQQGGHGAPSALGSQQSEHAETIEMFQNEEPLRAVPVRYRFFRYR